jgi:16S rRNA (cytosine1402-N4)-methyltransferase
MSITNSHIPVLLDEVLEFIFDKDLIKDSKNQNLSVFDGTLGGGGYTQGILDKASERCQSLELTSGDLDSEAIAIANKNIQKPDSKNIKFQIKHGNYAELIENFEDNSLDAIVLDLGYSSNQLEFSNRGFSYSKLDEPLDLRYDSENTDSCSKKLLKIHSAHELGNILYDNSGEQLSRRIAQKIYELNKKTPWTVGQMVELIISCLSPMNMRKKNQIMSRIWQSLRIWTNDEFNSINTFLPISVNKLKVGGKLIIVSFHSLEDKIVTNFMRQKCKPIVIDDYGNKKFDYELLTSKPLAPTTEEIESNTRSRSAILRCVRKLV